LLRWNEALATKRELIIPLQPGFGATPRIDWIATYRDLGAFYAWMVRSLGVGPVDVIGFSAGGYIAAEMAVASPTLLKKMVLVGPLGVRPAEGEIFDFLAVTVRTQLQAVASRTGGEYAELYGGDMSAEQYEALEDARAETARIGWEPFMFDPSLPYLLEGIGDLPTLLLWGEEDLVCPRGCIDVYERAIPQTRLRRFPGVGHRPDIEAPDEFVAAVADFLSR
jgi:pimeloyl-ACP methyl ester carboxylesterase